MNIHIYKGILVFSLATALTNLTACSDSTLDSINRDVNHPTEMAPSFVVTDIQMKSAFNVVGGDYNSYLGVAIEHEVGIFGQMYDFDQRNTGPEDPSCYNNTWEGQYNLLLDCKDIISQCTDGEYQGYYLTRGIGQIMLAYNLAMLTDLYGDTPWSQTGDYKTYMQPDLDKQEDIYKDVFAYLDQALEDLPKGDIINIAGADLIYKGDANLWIKAAYGLKARYTMRLLNRSQDKTGDLNKILDYVSKSFTSAKEEMKFAHYDASTSYNPLYAFCRSRDYLAASKSLADKMITRKDPRVQQIFVNTAFEQITPDDEDFQPAPNGTAENAQSYYSQSACNWAETAPTQFLSYHELLFLKAEAEARLGKDASATLQQAMEAAFENLAVSLDASIHSTFSKKVIGTCTLSADDVPEYFEANVLPLYKANPVKEIMIQKYLAFYGASGESVEAYNDYRRLIGAGENFIELSNPKNAPSGANPSGLFPLRCVYGSGDTTTNPKVYDAYGDGSYVYSEPVWWAGGSR